MMIPFDTWDMQSMRENNVLDKRLPLNDLEVCDVFLWNDTCTMINSHLLSFVVRSKKLYKERQTRKSYKFGVRALVTSLSGIVITALILVLAAIFGHLDDL